MGIKVKYLIFLIIFFVLLKGFFAIRNYVYLNKYKQNCENYSKNLFWGQNEIFTDIMPKFHEINNEYLKSIYYSTIKHMIDNGSYGLVYNEENKLGIVKYSYFTKKPKPECVQKMEFYAQNKCLDEKECYMTVKSVPYKKQNASSKEYKYYLQFLKNKSSNDIQYFKINRVKN